MTTYEYKIDYYQHYYSLIDVLSVRGLDGWELVAVGPQDSGGNITCYFKRPIKKSPEVGDRIEVIKTK